MATTSSIGRSPSDMFVWTWRSWLPSRREPDKRSSSTGTGLEELRLSGARGSLPVVVLGGKNRFPAGPPLRTEHAVVHPARRPGGEVVVERAGIEIHGCGYDRSGGALARVLVDPGERHHGAEGAPCESIGEERRVLPVQDVVLRGTCQCEE